MSDADEDFKEDDEGLPDADYSSDQHSDGHLRAQRDAAEALRDAGLEDSDEDAAGDAAARSDGEAGPSNRGGGDDFDATTEEVPKPALGYQRSTGPAEEWELPLVKKPEQQIRIMNFKSLLDIESEPFNADKFSLDDSVVFDENGRRIQRAPTLNRLRWRFTDQTDPETGSLQLESNARIVRWSDGSLSLFVGNECVDLVETPMEGQHMVLGAVHENNGCAAIQAQCMIHTRLAIRPPDVNSKLHRNMTRHMSPTRHKANKIKASLILGDFQADHAAATSREQEQLKLKEKQDKVARRRTAGPAYRKPVAHRLTAGYLEADDDYEEEYEDDQGRGGGRRPQYDEDEEEAAEKRLLQAKRLAPGGAGKRKVDVLGDEEDDVVLSDDDDVPQAARPGKRRLALQDSDDDF